MFENLVEKIKSAIKRPDPFDPSTLDDPIAMQTEWTPAKRGGASFCTHKLVEVNSNRLEFRAAAGAKAFYLLFLLIGLGVTAGFSFSKLSSGKFSFDVETIMPLLIGLVFTIVGGCIFYFGTAPIVFDRRSEFFWKGRKNPKEVVNKRTIKHFAELENIHALQLISEYCSGDKSSYYSYELNIVLENGKRINVIDHGKQNKLKEDANKLSEFLDKPIWNAI